MTVPSSSRATETPEDILVIDSGDLRSSYLLPDTPENRALEQDFDRPSWADSLSMASMLSLFGSVCAVLVFLLWRGVRFALWALDHGMLSGETYPPTPSITAVVWRVLVGALFVSFVVFVSSLAIPRRAAQRLRSAPGAHNVQIPAQQIRTMPEIGGLPASMFFWLAADAGDLDAELIDGVLKSTEKSEKERRLQTRIESITAVERKRRQA
ncbi:hypothetical protein [Brachybacterium kimchii]|uniref:Uncharacterized protein n=1 Tax=Brachybacterium kimchii TaxID=2942909 RepID=A0ABY4NAQ2_9MICO|nr:hypothetical protein [Brachybacterium kimchii]UQN30503.1 hypothetical protein M4486_03935 [Brachybacterium kimchii]